VSINGDGYACFAVPAACGTQPTCDCLRAALAADECSDAPLEVTRHEPALQ
jgi:hypothetical protein